MTINEFQKELTTKGSYETSPDAHRFFLDRLLGWSDTWYYLRAYDVVARGAMIAMRRKYPENWAEQSYRVMCAVEGCRGKINISGFENVTKLNGKAVVYVANHMAMVETLLIPSMLVPFNFLVTVVKESLLHYPVFGWIMRAVEPISVTRDNARDDLKMVLTKGEELLKKGRSVLVFPQATRSALFDPETFNSLGVKLASRAGVPVVPLALKTDFQKNGKLFKDVGPLDRKKTLYFKFGKHMEVNKKNQRETHETIVRFVQDNINNWQQTSGSQ